MKLIQLFVISLIAYLSILLALRPSHYAMHTIFLLFTIGCFYSLMGIVEKEVVKVLKGFGLQHSTHYMFSRRKTNFIPANNIYRVVINEVIYLVSVASVMCVYPYNNFILPESSDFCAANTN